MAKKGPFIVKIEPDEVMHTSISNTKNGYNSARIVVKKNDNEFMSVSYEWEGEGIPGFAMDLMGFMQASELKFGEVVVGKEDTFEEYSKKCGGPTKKMKKTMDEEPDDKKKKGKK